MSMSMSMSMSRSASVVLAVAAIAMSCAPAKPEKLERPKRIPHEEAGELPQPVFVDRPKLQLTSPTPDFHDELRWPLTSMSHPALEPRFEIASHFAQAGIGWMELCARGVQNSTGRDKELIAYLRGWCAAIKGDADAAVAHLTPLLGSTTSGLRAAVRTDLANILANGHADKAAHLIKTNNIRDVAVLDLLSANYVEVGTTAEAAAFNRDAIDSDDYATPATKCERLTKSIALTGNKMSPLLLEVEQLATKPKVPDRTCVRLHHKLQCWRDRSQCRAFYVDEGLDPVMIGLVEAYDSWPDGKSTRHWIDIVDMATVTVFPSAPLIPGARELTFAALENVVRSEPRCSESTRDWMKIRTKYFRSLLDAPDQAKLDAIIGSCN
jgi:hypothetical protein